MTPESSTVGVRMAFRARFLGRRLTYVYEITDRLPGEHFVQSTAEGPFPMEATYTSTDTPDGGTDMGLRNRGGPPVSRGSWPR